MKYKLAICSIILVVLSSCGRAREAARYLNTRYKDKRHVAVAFPFTKGVRFNAYSSSGELVRRGYLRDTVPVGKWTSYNHGRVQGFQVHDRQGHVIRSMIICGDIWPRE
jgi:hypothetical protein